MTPRAIELHAGGGGVALGLRAAGFAAVACVDGSASACATLAAAGFPAVHAGIGGRYNDGTDEDPRWVDGLDVGALPVGVDLLWASPPCQPYSRAGGRLGADDVRDGWRGTFRVIAFLRPRYVLVENVGGSPIEAWAGDLRDLGYHVQSATLDAADYGLPQTRRRAFLLAGPDGGPALPWPRPTHYGPSLPPLLRGRRGPWVTMGDALPELRAGSGNHVVYPKGAGRAASEPERLDRPAPTVTTTEVKGTRASEASGFDFHGGPDRASDAAFLATGRRRLTVAEVARLQGFPPWHAFSGSRDDVYRQIGNAVPPPLAELLGRVVRDALTATRVQRPAEWP